jgi:outer membrane protein
MEVEMKRPQTLLIYILISLAFVIRISHAEEDDSSKNIIVMTLEQVIEQALKANHKIIISEIDVQAADEARKEAFTGFLPRAETRYVFTRKSEPDWVRFKGDNKRYIIGAQDNYGWRTSAIQDLFKGFSILANYQIARLKLDVAKIRRAETRLDIILEARKKFIAVQNAKLLKEVAEKAVESLEEHLSVARDFLNVGLSPKIDVLNAEVDLAEAEQKLEKTANWIVVTKAALNNIMDKPVDGPIHVSGPLHYVPFETPYPECAKKALGLRPLLKETRAYIDIAKKEIILANSGFYPELTASLNYNRAGDQLDVNGSRYLDRENWDTSLTATWTFFEWGKTRYARHKAEKALERAKTQMRRVEDEIHFSVKKSYFDLKTARHNIEVSQKAVVSAIENLEISKDRYKEQVATITEVLDAQIRLTQARTSLTRALNDYNISLAELNRAMGAE